MKAPRLDLGRPAYRRVRARAEPLEVYRRLYGGERFGFIYESLEERGGGGRYSFIGGRPHATLTAHGQRVRIRTPDHEVELEGNPLHYLRGLVQSVPEALPVSTFGGGAVGYMGYDVIRQFAPVPDQRPDDLGLPEVYFVFPEEIIIFDHLDEVAHVVTYGSPTSRRTDEITAILNSCDDPEDPLFQPVDPPLTVPSSNMTEAEFADRVRQAQAHIHAGDIYQVVLSQRFQFEMRQSALSLYAALRQTNPSPYMYFLNLDGLQICGSSPEILVKLSGRRVITRPLAGTRPRGRDTAQDQALAQELLDDPKERAEHVMLVDLARNDIGRVCRTGSVQVEDYLGIERYSKVMHLVSHVRGRLRDDRDAFDLFESSFPAGTVSGAPKIRAMQLIDDLEPVRRGLYAGAIGYFSFLGDMDLCIAIRTLLVHGNQGYLQVGAGIVADSDPGREYQETLNKARGLLRV